MNHIDTITISEDLQLLVQHTTDRVYITMQIPPSKLGQPPSRVRIIPMRYTTATAIANAIANAARAVSEEIARAGAEDARTKARPDPRAKHTPT